MSAAAGFDYGGARFRAHFADFEEKYGFHDMYTGGFYPYETVEERWAFWSRNILLNRYEGRVGRPYADLLPPAGGQGLFCSYHQCGPPVPEGGL